MRFISGNKVYEVIGIRYKKDNTVYEATEVKTAAGKVWPDTVTVTYALVSVSVDYGNLNYLHPDADNYAAHITGILITYHDGIEYSRTDVTLTPVNYQSSNRITISGTSIKWNKATYGATIKSATSIPIRGTYAVGAQTFTEDLTISLGANSRTYTEDNTGVSWEAWTDVPYTGTGGYVYGTLSYEWYYLYTSGMSSTHTAATRSVTATRISPNQSWMTTSGANDDYLNVSANLSTSTRVGSARAYYDTIYARLDVTQQAYVAPTYYYRIAGFSLEYASMPGATFGTNNKVRMTVNVQYRINDGAWTNYTGSGTVPVPVVSLPSGASGHWGLCDNNGADLGTSANVIYSGTYDGSMWLYAKSAVTDENDITVYPILTYSDAEQTCTFTHEGIYVEPTISVSPLTASIDYDGGTDRFTVTANKTGWTVDTPAESWLSAVKESNTKVAYTAAANTGASRNAGITVRNGSASASFILVQRGAYVFELVSPTPFFLGPNDTSFRIEFISSQDDTWVPISVSHAIGWVSGYTVHSGVQSAYVEFTCSTNGSSDRSGTIVLGQNGSGRTITISVTQKASGFVPYRNISVGQFSPSSIRANRYGKTSGNVGVIEADVKYSWDNANWIVYTPQSSITGWSAPTLEIESQTTSGHFLLCSGIGGADWGTSHAMTYNSTSKMWEGCIYATAANSGSTQTATCAVRALGYYYGSKTFTHSKD